MRGLMCIAVCITDCTISCHLVSDISKPIPAPMPLAWHDSLLQKQGRLPLIIEYASCYTQCIISNRSKFNPP